MSPSSAFVYNVLTMGLIFPWTYLWAPGRPARRPARLGDPPGDAPRDPDRAVVRLAVDHVPADRRRLRLPEPRVRRRDRLHPRLLRLRDLDPPVGRAVRLAAGDARLRARSSWASRRRPATPSLVDIATWFTTPTGIIVTSVANALLALVILVSGFRNYIRLQRVMWVAILRRVRDDARWSSFTDADQPTSPAKLDAFSAAIGGSATFYGRTPSPPRRRPAST